MNDASERGEQEPRLFTAAQNRQDGLLAALAGLVLPTICLTVAMLVAWALGGQGWLVSLVGLGVGLAMLALAYDYLAVAPSNRRLRRRLIEKLRRLGELRFDPASPDVYYVGLAYRERRTNRWETDDEIGFLQVTADGLSFRGDRLTFDLAWSDLSAVELEPVMAGVPSMVERLRLETVSGEPFDWLAFSSREHPRLSRSNAVTETLAQAIQTRWHRRSMSRMTQSFEAQLAAEMNDNIPMSDRSADPT